MKRKSNKNDETFKTEEDEISLMVINTNQIHYLINFQRIFKLTEDKTSRLFGFKKDSVPGAYTEKSAIG